MYLFQYKWCVYDYIMERTPPPLSCVWYQREGRERGRKRGGRVIMMAWRIDRGGDSDRDVINVECGKRVAKVTDN